MEQQKETRLLPVENAYNVRDLGGYETADGKQVKWRKVIRSGDLNKLSDMDLANLERIGLKTYVDFRSEQEVKAAPDRTVSGMTELAWLPIVPGDMTAAIHTLNPDNLPSLIEGVYENLIRDYQEEYREFFRLLAIGDKAPLLFHCSAGKDRTGVGAALFLASLGVDRSIIMQDYLLSNEYLKGKYDFIVQKYPQFEPLTKVSAEYLQRAFDVIDGDFGGMEVFLTDVLGVDLGRMRELYLE